MNDIKPQIDQEKILTLLNNNFDAPIEDLDSIQSGEVARVFSFRVGQNAYILRINTLNMAASFYKEDLIYRQMVSPNIPIPPIVKVDRTADFVYAITQKLPGSGLDALSPAGYHAILPELIHILHAVHTSDVSRWTGYGAFDDSGRGLAASWRSYLAAVIDEEAPDGYFGKWHSLFTTTFLERGFHDTVYKFMIDLLPACPEERFFVHGDFGYNNILAYQGKITAVLDWLNAMYGDIVYDVAWMTFWRPEPVFSEMFRQYYADHGMTLDHYEDRIACYHAYIGLNALKFYAKAQNQPAYQYTVQILQRLLSDRGSEVENKP